MRRAKWEVHDTRRLFQEIEPKEMRRRLAEVFEALVNESGQLERVQIHSLIPKPDSERLIAQRPLLQPRRRSMANG